MHLSLRRMEMRASMRLASCERVGSRMAAARRPGRSAAGGTRRLGRELDITRAVSLGGVVDIPVPEAVEAQVEVLKSVDVNAIADQAKDLLPAEVTEYVNNIDQEYLKSEVTEGIAEVKGLLGQGFDQRESRIQTRTAIPKPSHPLLTFPQPPPPRLTRHITRSSIALPLVFLCLRLQ